MSKILNIARLTFRDAVRSKFVGFMIIILILLIGILAVSIKGDGTLVGRLKILLNYTLNISGFFLGLMTLWISCGSVSREIENKQIYLLAVKPVYSAQIWLGKWLGLLLVNITLLAITVFIIYAATLWCKQVQGVTPDDIERAQNEVLIARRQTLPLAKDLDKEAGKRFDALVKTGQIPDNMPYKKTIREIKKQLSAEDLIVAPGKSKQWILRLPHIYAKNSRLRERKTGDKDTTATLRVSFLPSFRSPNPVTGAWIIGPVTNDTSLEPLTFNISEDHPSTHEFEIPFSAIPSDGSLAVTFENADRAASTTVIFDSNKPIELLIAEGKFEMNFLRTFLIMLCKLAALGAIGLTAGIFFSLPVATFSAYTLIVIALIVNYFSAVAQHDTAVSLHHSHGPTNRSVAMIVGESIASAAEIVVNPAMQFRPIAFLSEGLTVSWSLTGKAVLILIIIYCGTFCAAGSYCLSRREFDLLL
ncbi:MAG: ABC transporter permease [Lentisphaerae bacterium]|nr:ABC transporter permease [Lentisphaerota bacterium]